jgi:isopentenyl-diphosphate delta-isomerase type 2
MGMSESATISARKARHLEICLDPSHYQVEPRSAGLTDFAALRFAHRAMPDIYAGDLDLATDFLGYRLRLPVFISCMTGGSDGGFMVNRELARAAGRLGIAVGTGSVRILLDHPELDHHFALKTYAPDVPVLANIGAVQVRDIPARRLDAIVGRIAADALVVHLNPGQELFQPDGDRDFRGVRDALLAFIRRAPYPVVVKETGFGLAPAEIKALLDAGASCVDLAGSGGTNWVRVEGYRGDADVQAAAAEFSDWGYPTAALLAAVSAGGSGRILASGGIRSGMDVAKALALGAAACGLALPLARAASQGGAAAVERYIGRIEHVLRTVMILTGSSRIVDLGRPGVLLRSRSFDEQVAMIAGSHAI